LTNQQVNIEGVSTHRQPQNTHIRGYLTSPTHLTN
jgi:hypothetical protein